MAQILCFLDSRTAALEGESHSLLDCIKLSPEPLHYGGSQSGPQSVTGGQQGHQPCCQIQKEMQNPSARQGSLKIANLSLIDLEILKNMLT